MKDPEIYLEQLRIAVPGALDDGTYAIVDADHKSYVNWEVFFFSSRERRDRFEAEPLSYCGVVTDPITGERFRPDDRSPRFDYAGRPYFFTSAASMERFKSMPDELADPDLEMQ